MKKLGSISAFFPACNEEGNVERMCASLAAVLPEVADDYEIIVVDDGSRDRTGEIADRLSREDPRVRVVHHGRNLGYGAAVRSGIAACRKEHVFLTDGDCQFDVGELRRLVPLLEGCDAVIGFRAGRRDPWPRRANGWAWNFLVRLVFGLDVRDVDCAFKLFRRRVFDGVRLTSSGAMISTEVLVRMRRRGLAFREAGVRHFPRAAGKQSGADLRVIVRAFRELYAFATRREETP